MTAREQQRSHVLTRLIAGELALEEAAVLLGCSVRHAWRLKAALLSQGPAEREGIAVSRQTLQRLLRGAGLASPRRRRAARHRQRRERMPQPGLLLQLDGSRHDWLERRGPWPTLLAAIDDVTGLVPAACFREQEDALGYLALLDMTIRRHGVTVAVYRDRHSAFAPVRPRRRAPPDASAPALSQVGRALVELGIGSIAARSPQAKGRIERLFGTFQDRLVAELRLAGAADLDAANRVLARFLTRYNRRFTVPPADPAPAWRALPASVPLERVCCLKYRRLVAPDHTVRLAGTVLQLPRGPGRNGNRSARRPASAASGRVRPSPATTGRRPSRSGPASPSATGCRGPGTAS